MRCSHVLALLACAPLLTAAFAAAPSSEYTFAFLRSGPKRAEFKGEAMTEMMRGHMANIGRLAAEKKLAVAGPFGSPSPDPQLRGIFIFFGGDVAAAEALCQTDPSIAAGIFSTEVVPFRTTKDLGDVLRRAMVFEERRKADPSIPMKEGMSTYVLLFADDHAKAAAALGPVRAGGSIVMEGSFGGARAGKGLFLLDARDTAAGEALLAPHREALGSHQLMPWYGSAELRRSAATP